MSEIGRRGFLGWMGAATAAALATTIDDPERLLWTPGKKTFFLPPEKKIIPAVDAAVEEIRRANAQHNIEWVEYGYKAHSNDLVDRPTPEQVMRALAQGKVKVYDRRYGIAISTERGVERFTLNSDFKPVGNDVTIARANELLGRPMNWRPAVPNLPYGFTDLGRRG